MILTKNRKKNIFDFLMHLNFFMCMIIKKFHLTNNNNIFK
jgi:hypothetical protein